ncbi:hypothetical protein HPP92_005072 [Vanilla planifolia]|uniref:Uncharacterized protein n=1 Tax=Vanilla planifolia TaxID=51239 RepID=A0A835RI26_VANPL|nr:hypothetical protein HPP92_005072 [Vanilla planifolia]
MGLDVDLDSKKHFEVGLIPKIAYSSHEIRVKERFECYANEDDRSTKEGQSSIYYFFDVDANELCLYHHSSSHQKRMSSGFFETDLKDNVVIKRGSMYQSSSEVQRMQRLRYDRTKKEMDVNDDAFLSFDFNNSSSLGSSKETLLFTEQMSVPIGMEQVYPSVDSMHLISKDNVEFLDLSLCDLPEERSKISISCSDAGEECSISSDSLLRICLQTREFSNLVLKTTPESFEKAQIEEKNCNRNQLVNTRVDADKTYERSEICILPKSFSAKLGNSYLSFHSWGEVMKSISKNRSSPLKKMLDPIMKSKSQAQLIAIEPRN